MSKTWDVIVVGAGPGGAREVIEARERKCSAEGIYLDTIDEILGRFREVARFGRRVGEAAAGGDPRAYAEALLKAWDRALKLF